ncbi:MAG: MOSC domain-containing protein [Candidatus Eisenbacteria bacterium]|uniref:MOSC domain-containing protein n=1 Tax=Eiseniibacteriota bacterium TaxID=2212470 RepID=A0A956RP65_UNCEI|nr:MOSC domain-containing protein [Candidatus Eisenbacteria bacterium]
MRVVSVNVGRPREVSWNGEMIRTSIWKEPVSGPVPVIGNNLQGDVQSDLRVHGGPDKAVYAYPVEHYSHWRRELPELSFPSGAFGENLTVEGFDESALNVGDRFRVGTAELVVTQPRVPCFKLGIRFGRADMVQKFARSERCGFYLSVAREGEIAAGDSIEPLGRDERDLSVLALFRIYARKERDPELLRRAAEHPGVPSGWREWMQQLIEGEE